MFNSLKSLFAGRKRSGHAKKTLELEATLSPVAGAAGHGEAEYAAYSDGGRTLEIELDEVGPGEVEVIIGPIAQRFTIASAKAEFKLATSRGNVVPECREGERIDIRRSGVVILSGTFRRD